MRDRVVEEGEGLHDGGFGILLLVAGVADDRNNGVKDGMEEVGYGLQMGLSVGCRGD